MKRNKVFISLGALALAMSSCTDLDVDVVSQYSKDPSANSGVDPMIVVEAKMANVYYRLRGTIGRRYMEAQCLASDEFTALAFDGGYFDAGTYAYTALHCNTAEDATLDWYSEATAGITLANQVLEELGEGASVSMTAPARAIRAYFTWVLMDNFGDTPILDKVAAEGEPTADRSPRKDVALWLENELTTIIPELTTDVNANTYGKPTRWMAEALLAKIYINWPVYTAQSVDQYDASTAVNERLTECIALCDDIIDGGKFNLGSMAYRFKFAPNNGPQVEDFIYAMPFDAIDQQGMQYARPRSYKNLKNMMPNYYGSTDKFSQSFGGNIVVSPEFASIFCLEGDERNNMVLGGPVFNYDPVTLLPTSEPFLVDGEQLVFTKDITLAKQDNTIDVGTETSSYAQGYHSIKWFIVPEDYNNGRNQSNDVPIFRYADVLLMKAEALVRSHQSGAMELFNQVRSYAKAPTIAAEPTLEEIYDERGREFFDENWRRNDMIRFGTYEGQFFPHYTDFPGANFDKRHRIFPIEKEMLDLNTNWQQNPGY
ncbi:MAG: RagB/SusD family nutrient uptake outer membrane protein [Bacteroidales bacterium]|nr:RagB/SusD family nutrient uptake outer membrane protein [Bacteroidales bacterium]